MQFVRYGEPRVATIESDDYIPVAVDWATAGTVGPIYYWVSDPHGGDVELRIEPLRGEVVGVTMIESPVRRTSYLDRSGPAIPAEPGAVFVDVGPWGPNPDRVPTRTVVREAGTLTWSENETEF